MKNKLFTVASVVLLYALFTVLFVSADNQGVITSFLTRVGLTNTSAIASPALSQNTGIASSELAGDILRRPSPPKPKPKPKPPTDNQLLARINDNSGNQLSGDILRRPSPPKPKPKPPTIL
ncbi:MAG: hypothetical protein ACE5HO_06910 [bacterium]